jgi:serine/threonine protein phosphatase PrpC
VTATKGAPEWRIIGETVPGASHLRAGIPNQDAILQLRESGRGLPLVLSVSDGHGSDKCFRSHRGSRFAVKVGTRLVVDFLDEPRGAFDPREIGSSGEEWLSEEFVRRWRESVEADLRRRPFTKEEFKRLEEKDGEHARKMVEANPLLAYGATSLTVAVEESFILYLQLGDGEILTVSESGKVNRPLPEDARLFANETTSLCSRGAEHDFRFCLQKIEDERPALILLSTDGYVNSFSSHEGFLKVGSDLLEMLRSDGFDYVNESLKGWLEEATRVGSGDDTTLGIICRMDALKKQLEVEAPAPSEAGAKEDMRIEPEEQAAPTPAAAEPTEARPAEATAEAKK